MEGRAIDTIGYRGMHSYEVALDDWFVPAANLIGGEGGLGKGFYYQMAGFENGRLQTAARAIGVMQAAYEAARDYAENRVVFGQPIGDYQLTQAKLGPHGRAHPGRPAVLLRGGRADGQGRGHGSRPPWSRPTCARRPSGSPARRMQIHGGMGYAEEYDVSRYFVDARVLSIFEGADETLCLKVIARRLVADLATA